MVFLEYLCRDCTQHVKICTRRLALLVFRQKWLLLSLVYKFRGVRLRCTLRADLQAPLKTFNKRNGNN